MLGGLIDTLGYRDAFLLEVACVLALVVLARSMLHRSELAKQSNLRMKAR